MSRGTKKPDTRSESLPLRNWAVRDHHGRTCLVIEAASAAAATERVAILLREAPPIPPAFTILEHEGPVRCSWFGDGWFRIREDIDRADHDTESRAWQQLCDTNAEGR